ncbi:MAG: TonB-dependent receptor [Fusobacteria bacterium]|nr:MAG: TonB-dependent receptor [Fusobacteriota bacterium]
MRSRFLQLLTLALVLVGNIAFAQSKEITGVVYDESNMELPGASVIVKGSTVGTTTDFDGAFTITAQEGDVLEVDFIGYTTKYITVGESSTYKIQLVPDSKELEEVIVVGYGTAKKESFTGSATQMKGEELTSVAVPTITDALQGKSAGLQINSASGDPGSGSTVRIRGIGSMNASSSPLYVIDGVIVNSGNVSQLSDGSADLAPTDVLSSINPNDIASMTVLKDASATAIYGARAANGVILITTKKGANGKAKISFDAKVGISQLPKNRGYHLMSSADHYKQYFDAYRAAGESVADANRKVIEALSNNNPYNVDQPLDENGNVVDGARIISNTDWVDEVFRTGKTQEYNISASGGSGDTNYFLSLGYANTEGIMKGTDFSRYSLRLNLNTKLTERIDIGTNTTFSYTDQNRGAGGGGGAAATRNALLYPNAVSVYEKDREGNIIYDDKGKPKYNFNNPVSMDFNPLFTVDNDIYNTKNYRLLSSLYLNADLGFILEGLSFRTDNSVDYYTVEDFMFYNPFHGNGTSVNGRGRSYGTWNTLLTTSNKFNYKKIFGDHTIDVLAGIEVSENHERTNYAEATEYAIYGDVVMPELANAATPQGASTTDNRWSMLSYLGRINYDYLSKYYLSASIRRDGSSRFGENNRFGTFYSFGASWRISEENFMQDISWIDNLKLRASYGTSGNDQVGLYDYFTNFSSWNYDGKPGNVLFKPGNEDLTWETSASTTIGLDFTMFSQRLSGSIEYYNRDTDDLLYQVPISMLSGFTTVMKNSASVNNHGVELALDYRLIETDNFSWDMGVNYTMNVNEITSLPTESQINGTKIWQEGGSIYDFYLREYAGVDKNDGAAMWYKDVIDPSTGKPTGERELTKSYNEATRYVVGSSQPDGYGGFNNTLRYKRVTLSANLFFSNGGNILDVVESDLMNDGNEKGYQLMTDAANAWTPSNTNTDVPKFNTVGDNNSNQSSSTRYLYDATYAKLKAVTLSYDLPSSWAKRVNMTSMSTYVSGNNLLIWTKDSGFKGFDPEVGMTGLTNYITPNPRSVVVGIKLNF